jgi:acyl-CoA thioesterase-1
VGRDEETWVHRVAKAHDLVVHNYSRPGATVGMALRQAREVELASGIILLEIGGNDLLGVTSEAVFERQLDELLERVCGEDRIVLMFELPLPPLRNNFGAIQRALAAKHGVRLIPKRVLIGVLTARNATHDGIHLTAAGHALMAETVWSVLAPAYGE